MKKIALEGPINACSDAECVGWRKSVIERLDGKFLFHNPMEFDCRGKEGELEKDMVKFDESGLASSDIVLVMADKPGWGTAMAVQIAYSAHKEIVVVCGAEKPSPWLKNRASVLCKTLEDALIHIERTL